MINRKILLSVSGASCSSVFSGTFLGRSVAVERVKKTHKDQQTVATALLKLNHQNVDKVFHTEEDTQFR